MKKLESYSEEELRRCSESPWVSKLVIPVSERPTKRRIKIPGTNKTRAETYFAEIMPHTRLISTVENRTKLFKLSKNSIHLLNYILFTLEQGKDYVQINMELYKKVTGVSADNTFLSARKQLVAKGFIAHTGIYKTVYWINPAIFFPGNRIQAFEDKLDLVSPFNQPAEGPAVVPATSIKEPLPF